MAASKLFVCRARVTLASGSNCAGLDTAYSFLFAERSVSPLEVARG
jgi:hypothetical protein